MRLRIAIRNLLISESVILIFLIFAYFVWFPYSFSKLGGFHETAFMLIFVDLVLGPILVFLIYKEGKKHLTFDINILLAIQMLAFIYGAYAMYLKHPAHAVFNNNKFSVVNVSDLYPDIPLFTQINKYFLASPSLVYLSDVDAIERDKILFDIYINGGPDIHHRPKYFKDIDSHKELILSKSLKIENIYENLEDRKKIDSLINEIGGELKDFAYLPLEGNNQKKMIWVFSRKNSKPVGIIDIDTSKFTNVNKIALH